MKSAQWLPQGDGDIVMENELPVNTGLKRTPCEHWLEALRPASHAKVQVMHQIVCVFFLLALTSGDAYKLRCKSSLAPCGITGFVRPV